MKFLPDQTLISAGKDRVVRQWDMVIGEVQTGKAEMKRQNTNGERLI